MQQDRPDFDYSTVEAQQALTGVTQLIAEVRAESRRKIVLYERTLGLAVIPVLVRRAFIVLLRHLGRTRRG